MHKAVPLKLSRRFLGEALGRHKACPYLSADWRARGRHKAGPYCLLIGGHWAGTRPAPT